MKLLEKYFPELTKEQLEKYSQMKELYAEWNQKINVISRKDIDSFEERHLLHSLALTKLKVIKEGDRIMDLGAGGGFPGIPLSIYYPNTEFVLVDSIRKKTTVIQEIVDAIGIENVKVINARAEDVNGKFNQVISRAVAPLLKLNGWAAKSIDKSIPDNGMLCLKGGDLFVEIAEFEEKYPNVQVIEYAIKDYYKEEFFETKKMIRLLNY